MSKEAKIIIGANYGDEGKGLLTRHFCLQAIRKGKSPLVIFHNGTAQRGHTVDYSNSLRHVYHHFGSGSGDGVITYFADSFYVHPMEYHREYWELRNKGIFPPSSMVSGRAKVITPFDMVVDRATEEWIAKQSGEREFGSCAYGSWCAIEDRFPLNHTCFTVRDFDRMDDYAYKESMKQIWQDCLIILQKRGVDLSKTSFHSLLKDTSAIVNNFRADINFMLGRSFITTGDEVIFNGPIDCFIFENGQGLGLDKNVEDIWHTTSNTGLTNPYNMLTTNVKEDFNAEVCYVTRSYLTRHGLGGMEDEVHKNEINKDMVDKTNVFNEFQGGLRYGNLALKEQENRITKDFDIAEKDKRFTYNIAVTHTNEQRANKELCDKAKYVSDNPFNVKENV